MKLICEKDCEISPVNDARRNSWSLISGAIVVLMPKCALCWAAYMSLLSSFGIVIKYQPWFLPVAVALFGITLTKLVINGYRDGNYLSVILALVAGVIIFVNRGSTGEKSWQIIGLGLMFAGVVITPFLRRKGNHPRLFKLHDVL